MINIKQNNGLTLVELMIAMLLGLIVVGAVIFMFLEVKNSSRQNENIGRMQENARYTLNLFTQELRNAGFYGGMLKGSYVEMDNATLNPDSDAAVSDNCSSGDDWLYNIGNPIWYKTGLTQSDINGEQGCISSTDLYDGADGNGTDSISIRSVSADPIAVTDDVKTNTVYLRTNGSSGCLWHSGDSVTNSPNNPAICPSADAFDWEFQTNLYYIDNSSGTPRLCRKKLSQTTATTITSECLVDGIERFYIEFGLDNDFDALAENYTNDPGASTEAIV